MKGHNTSYLRKGDYIKIIVVVVYLKERDVGGQPVVDLGQGQPLVRGTLDSLINQSINQLPSWFMAHQNHIHTILKDNIFTLKLGIHKM